jgi:hypothetical protein
MANITTTTAAVFIPEQWSTDVLRAREANLTLANLVHRYDSEVSDNGNKINVPNISNLTANQKVAGANVSFQAVTETEIEIDIDQHYECSFRLEDIVKIQSKTDLNAEYTNKTGYAIAQKIDSTISALASGFSQTKGTYNTAITSDVILDSIQLLDDADVPQDDRHFVMKPKTKRDIVDITTYISNDFVDGRPVVNGKLGSVYGVNTYMTTQIVKTGNNTDNMMFHRDALGLALQKDVTTNSWYNTAAIAHEVVTDAIWGVKEMRDDHGVLVKT